MQKKPHGPKFTAGRFTLLKRKNFLQKVQDIILPWSLRIKDLIRDRGAYDRSDIFLIEQARFICQKRCGEDDIRRTGAFVCFIPVEDSAVDKYTAVIDVLQEFNVPILMDVDLGHLAPSMPIKNGAKAVVSYVDGNIKMEYLKKYRPR